MDANNTPYFLLRSADELRQGSSRMEWHPRHQTLTLRQKQQLRLPSSQPDAGLTAWATATPMAVDEHYQVARLNEDADKVIFNSGGGWQPLKDDLKQEVETPEGAHFTDMALSQSGLLALPFSDDADLHGLTLFHLGKRWLSHCSLPEAPRRALIDADQGIWCLSEGSLMFCEGSPLPAPYAALPSRFEPEVVNPGELAHRWTQTLPAGWHGLALACVESSLCILAHNGLGQQIILCRPLDADPEASISAYEIDEACPFAVDMATADGNRLALLALPDPGDSDFRQRDCPVVSLVAGDDTDTGKAILIYERYPMLGLAQPRFASSADGQLRYQAPESDEYPGFSPRPRELHALRQPRYEESASALLKEVLDSGAPGTTWHRLYLDACIPAGCSIRIAARVYDDADARGATDILMQPDAVWNPLPSELAYQPALSGYEKGRRGLFEILLQRPEGPVRTMNGRYLQLQVHMTSNGRTAPAIHAIRVYGPRFSYQEAYLPELFRQEQTVAPDNSRGAANGADVRERLLAGFESILTPLEGRIAAAEQLLHPATAPSSNLGWLAETLGRPLPAQWPEARKRRWLQHQTLIQQYKGTLPGLNLALDIATDGGVQKGSVVIVENFRLRRTMATVLGVSMDDSDHPLTLGTGISGNSIIGDSLILSDMNAREFLALFAPELADEDERIAVAAFFEKYAHRLSILLHGDARQQRHEVEALLADQLPAHLQWQIIETQHPFILGTSPLLNVDTWIEPRPADVRVTVNETRIGREGVLVNPLAFSPADINHRQSSGGAMT